MRQLLVCVLLACAAVATGAGTAAARPTVAVAGVEVAGDSVGVDVEAVGIARELTQGLRRAADRADGPLQLVDPMVVADDVEALVWGKLIRDGDGWVATIHLSAVGADGDTVSYRAVITQSKTSSVELTKWGKIIYESLLDQIDIDDKDDVPAPGSKPGTPHTPIALNPSAAHPQNTGPVDPFAVRDPRPEPDTSPDAVFDDSPAPVSTDRLTDDGPAFARDRVRPDPQPNASARRLFWISAGVAGLAGVFWVHAAFQIADAEDQIDRLAGCTGCERAIEAANAQGNRWEGLSWLAGTATVAGVTAALLFGYQGYVVGRRPAPSELVGARAHPRRAVTVTPVLGPDRVGAGVSVSF